jgi:molybdenum cofactor biosynthesis enzyme MoaA
MTPEGLLRSCLFDGGEVDLKRILRGNEGMSNAGDLASRREQLRAAFTTCVAMKPETHSFRGNKAMNRIGG